LPSFTARSVSRRLTWTGLKNLDLSHRDKVSLIDNTNREISISRQTELLGHQSLNYMTPAEVYFQRSGEGEEENDAHILSSKTSNFRPQSVT
jgi:hypothetical protein